MSKSKQPNIFDYHDDADKSHLKRLHFPDVGDTVWYGDDMGEIVERHEEPLMKQKTQEDSPYTRYIEIKIIVKI